MTYLFVTAAIVLLRVVHRPPVRWLQLLCLAILGDALAGLEAYAVRSARRMARARYKHKAWDWLRTDTEYAAPSLLSAPFFTSMWRQSGNSSDIIVKARFHRPACRA